MTENFDAEKFEKDIRINRAHLEDELCDNPSFLAYYIQQAVQWTEQYDIIKTLIKNRASELYIQIKESGERSTEGLIDAKIQVDERWQELNKRLIKTKTQMALYQGAVTALEKKQFSLGSLNAMNRMEMDATNSYSSPRFTQEERLAARDKVIAGINT